MAQSKWMLSIAKADEEGVQVTFFGCFKLPLKWLIPVLLVVAGAVYRQFFSS
jgi:hypothetical protein